MTNFHLKGRGYDLTLDNICPFPLMGSQLFARDVIFELTNKSTEWNVFLEVYWRPINERILLTRYDSKYSKLSIIQCYAPTNDAEEEEKENVYKELQAITSTTPRHDILITMGDINAKVGADNTGREDHMARNAKGTRNKNLQWGGG